MVRRSAVLFLALVACFPIVGSSRPPQQETKPAAPAAPQAAVATNEVVVKVQGEPVTEKQMLVVIGQLASSANPPLTAAQMQQRNTMYYRQALDTLIGGILLKNEGKEKGLVVDQAKVEQELKTMKSPFANEEAYQKALSAQGITDADLRNSVAERLLIQLVITESTKNLAPTSDAEVQKFYDENPQYFQQLRGSMIFVKVNTDATAEQKDAARKKLQGVRAEIDTKKITFAEAAGKYSDDKKSGANGGDMGVLKRGELLDPIEKALQVTKPGTMTPVIETEFGYYLVELKQQEKAPLDAALKTNIKNYLDQKANIDTAQKHVDELKAKAKIEMVMTEEEWNKRHAGK